LSSWHISLSFYLKSAKIDTSKAILLGLAGIVGYELLAKTQALGTVNFFPGKLHSLSFDGATPIVTVQLLAQNTSNKLFTMQSIAGNVYTDNYLVGNVSNFTAVQIAPNTQTAIPIKIRLSLLAVVNEIIAAIQTGNFSKTLYVDAHANIDGLQVPIKETFKVGV
jgi:hypothetical protein